MTEPQDARTPTTEYLSEGFIRTALVIGSEHCGSVDVVDGAGKRLAQINIFHLPKATDGQECLMVDVIDVDGRYTERRALVFSPTSRQSLNVPEGGNLVGAHFARKV